LIKRSTRVVMTALLGVAGMFLAVSPASAACASGNLCLYQNTNYGGGKYTTSVDNYTYHDGDTFDNGFHLYDAVSSYENTRSDRCWYLFTDHYYSGREWTIYPSERLGQLIGYNDVASSHYWDGISTC
jgi:hypothetical protein